MRRLAICTLLTATACAAAVRSFGGIPKSDLNSLVGQDISTAVTKWGAPNRQFSLGDSTTVYTWESQTRGSPDYGCVKSLVVSNHGKIMRWTANDQCPIV